MTELMDRLTNRKISNVISIDDENAPPLIDNIDALTDAIATASAAAIRSLVREDARFNSVMDHRTRTQSLPAEERRIEIRRYVEELVDTEQFGANDYRRISRLVYGGRVGATE
jgi:hypothetical protein